MKIKVKTIPSIHRNHMEEKKTLLPLSIVLEEVTEEEDCFRNNLNGIQCELKL